MKRLILPVALALGASVALPSIHYVFRPPRAAFARGAGAPPMGRELARAALEDWDEGARDVERAVNPEWDLGHRTFFVLALVNLAMDAAPAERDAYRAAVNAAVDDVRARPIATFHLPYFRGGALRQAGARSAFFEGELLMMEAARLAAWPDPARHAELDALGARVVGAMRASPALMAESYPDECWMYDNTLSLAALALSARVLGRPVAGAEELRAAWRARARASIEPHTGLLVASTTWDGATLDGPEGSSAFAVAHWLQLVDPELARDQYARAKRLLVARPLGFAFAREWPDPALWKGDPLPPRAGHADVDSGPIVPLLDAAAGASGMAVLGAAAFGDAELLGELTASLELAAFPERRGGRLRYRATNALGDAVLAYALAQGPLWDFARGARGEVRS